jgi:hypothetical protein
MVNEPLRWTDVDRLTRNATISDQASALQP